MNSQKRITHVAVFLAALTLPTSGLASTNGFTVAAFRGSAQTEYAGWDTFTAAYNGPNAPLGVGLPNTSDAVITQTKSDTAFLTGSGNIYDLTAPTGFRLDDTAPFTIGQVLFQARSVGSEIKYDSVLLSYSDATGAHSLGAVRSELLRGPGAGGTAVVSAWEWILTGLGVQSYSISWEASESSMSFDAAMLDTAQVPEPAAISLLGLGALGLVRWGRRCCRPTL